MAGPERKQSKSGVERLKSRLYARKNTLGARDERTALMPSDITLPPTEWVEEPAGEEVLAKPVVEETLPVIEKPANFFVSESKKKKISIATIFFISSAAFFSVTAFAAVYLFFNGSNSISPQNIDMEVVAPSLVDAGKPTAFQILITNRNKSELQLADIIIDYPDGTRNASNPSQLLQHDRQSIGTIRSGEQIKVAASGVLYGQEGATQTIKATLEYSVAGSNAVFQRATSADITIGSSPVSLSIDSPVNVNAHQQFSIDVTVRSNASAPIANVVVQGVYPFGFTPTASLPAGDAGNTLWRLGTLAPGSTQVIHLTGTIEGQDGDQRIFRFLAGSNDDQTDAKIKVPFVSVPQTVTVSQSFISATLSVGGQTGKTVSASAGTPLQGSIQWKNNLPDALSEVRFALAFSGPALDPNSISSANGFYQSAISSIIWSKDQANELASVAPGASGTLQFSFATLPPGTAQMLITNPTITLNLSVQGVRTSTGGSPQTITNIATTQVQLASQTTLTAETLRLTGPFANGGPVPPKAEAVSSYTVMWTVKNASNAIANTSVSTVLPSYVQFYTTQKGNGVTYDSTSRTVRWDIGDLKAGVGYATSPLQAAFQVAIVPSASQVGTAPTLTSGSSLVGTDRFAQVPITANADAVTTHSNEPGFISGMDIVAPKQ